MRSGGAYLTALTLAVGMALAFARVALKGTVGEPAIKRCSERHVRQCIVRHDRRLDLHSPSALPWRPATKDGF